MSISNIQLFQDIQNPDSRQVIVDSPNGTREVYQVDAATFSQLVNAGFRAERTSGTSFQSSGGTGGTIDLNALKQKAADLSDLPGDLQQQIRAGSTAHVNAFNISQKMGSVDISKLATTGGDVVTPGVDDQAALAAQGYTSGGTQNLRSAADLQASFLATPEGQKLQQENTTRLAQPTQAALAGDFKYNPSAPAGYLTNAQGQLKQVSEQEYQTAKTGSLQTQGSAATPTAALSVANASQPPNAASTRAQLQSLGIDVAGLNDQQVQTLGMMNQVMLSNADKNKSIVPASLSTGDMDKFLQEARAELGPYYNEQFESARRDLLQATSFITGETQYQEADAQRQMQAQQQQLAEQAAEAGLAQSGIRKQAEQKLQEQQLGVVTSNRRKLQQQLYGIGSQFEQQFGIGGLNQVGGIGIKSSAFPTLGLQGQNVAYTPQGIAMGSFGASQAVAEQQRAQQLAGGDLQKRNLLGGLTS